MKEIMLFQSNDFGQVRTLEENGKILFCGSDVARALGYTNPNKAINDHCRAITKRDTHISGKIQSINFILEGDVYRLIVSSRLPSAEKFEKWVFDEILPTIRQTGKYETEPSNSLEQNGEKFSPSQVIEAMDIIANCNNGKADLLFEIARKYMDVSEFEESFEIVEKISLPKKCRKRSHSIIEGLPPALYNEVVKMLIDGLTYREVAEYLTELGYTISTVSVHRFGHYHFGTRG